MATLSIRIDDDLDAELQWLADETHRTKSDLAREMLRRQLQVALFEQVREKIVPYAEAAGYLTDEDVFRDVS
jgi:predicted transcriptional regulator